MQRTHFRRPFANWWRCVALATVVTFGLSMTFFPAHLAPAGQEPFSAAIWLDSFYHSLQMFVLNWETLPRPIPWPLQVARFLAAFVALSTVILALIQLFRERVGLLLLGWRRDYVVLCGLGPRGIELVRDLRAQGRKVVVIEGQENHPDLAGCRAAGAIVLIGSPTDRGVLDQARVHRAAILISLFQEDAASIETLMVCCRLNANRSKGHLRCIVQIFDHGMRTMLTAHKRPSAVHLELFNLFDIGAQVMLRENPALFQQAEPRRLLIVGMGWLGQALLNRVVHAWRIDRLATRQVKAEGHPEPREEVIIVDRDIGNLESRLATIRKDDCKLFVHKMDVEGDAFLAGQFLRHPHNGNTIDAAFVCLPDDRLAVVAVDRLREHFGPKLPLVVRMTSRRGPAELLEAQGMEGVHVVGLHDLASTMPLVTNAPIEMIAREIHRDYVLDRFAHGETNRENALLIPWHMLKDDKKESNRQAAIHIDAKLKAVGCEKYPVKAIDALFEFTAEQVDLLAKEEHHRWCAERRRGGWKYGPKKDDVKKESPYLVDYADLPDGADEPNRTAGTKESNRTAIRHIPVWLAKAGFGIGRLPN